MTQHNQLKKKKFGLPVKWQESLGAYEHHNEVKKMKEINDPSQHNEVLTRQGPINEKYSVLRTQRIDEWKQNKITYIIKNICWNIL